MPVSLTARVDVSISAPSGHHQIVSTEPECSLTSLLSRRSLPDAYFISTASFFSRTTFSNLHFSFDSCIARLLFKRRTSRNQRFKLVRSVHPTERRDSRKTPSRSNTVSVRQGFQLPTSLACWFITASTS